MTVTLNLPPHVEQLYLAEAQARGLPLEKIMLEALVTARLPAPEDNQLSPDERMRRFTAWSEGPSHTNLPDLSDEAISRESIYTDLGL